MVGHLTSRETSQSFTKLTLTSFHQPANLTVEFPFPVQFITAPIYMSGPIICASDIGVFAAGLHDITVHQPLHLFITRPKPLCRRALCDYFISLAVWLHRSHFLITKPNILTSSVQFEDKKSKSQLQPMASFARHDSALELVAVSDAISVVLLVFDLSSELVRSTTHKQTAHTHIVS